MSIDAKELNSRLWAEWKNGMKIMAESLLKDSVDISGSGCTIVLGNENFIQRAVIYIQRKFYIGKFKDYKTRISAYETTAMRSPDTASPAKDRQRGRLERLKSRLRLNQYSKRKWSGFQWGECKGTHTVNLVKPNKKMFPSPIVMQMCYNTHVFHESGEPYRSGTGEDRLPCPPRDRRQLCMTANTAFIGNTGHISRGNERHGCELCVPLGRLARFDALVSGLTRASGECMGEGKSAPSSCVRHGARRR